MPLAVAPVAVEPNLAPAGSHVLNIPQIFQEQTEWCWAACAQMVSVYYGNAGLQQSDLANRLFGLSVCSLVPGSSLCNRMALMSDICNVYKGLGRTSTFVPNAVPFGTLQQEINAGRPVQVGFSWSGGGHLALVCGWDINSIGPFLRVNDPQYGSGGVYYSNLVAAYGLGSWQFTWLSIA
jgi:hypothetical protein